MLTNEVYRQIQCMIYKPSPANKRCIEQVLKLDFALDKEDLIQMIALEYHEKGTEKKMENFVGSILRKTLRQLRKKPVIVSLDDDHTDRLPYDKSHSLEGPEPTPEQILLCAIVSSDLSDLDVDVILNNKTRQEAADELGISYVAYKKRIKRKLDKVRKDYDCLLTFGK